MKGLGPTMAGNDMVYVAIYSNVMCGVYHRMLELSIKEGRNLNAMDRNGIHALLILTKNNACEIIP